MQSRSDARKQLVVVGGGVAGVCCVEELEGLVEDDSYGQADITLICGSHGFIKTVTNAEQLTQLMVSFDVAESSAEAFFESRNVRVVQDDVVAWSPDTKSVTTSNGTAIKYDKLCIATGARARRDWEDPLVMTIRDTDTVEKLQERLPTARRVLVVGNGGIATELVFELKNAEIVWAIRHESMSATYFDEVAAKFFEPALRSGRHPSDVKPEAKYSRYTIARDSKTRLSSDKAMPSEAASTSSGCALGPHWLSKLKQTVDEDGKEQARQVHIVNHVEVRSACREKPPEDSLLRLPEDFAEVDNWPLWVEFTNGKTLGCDLVIQATGVTPNSDVWRRDSPQLALADDGGILVNDKMETNVPDVYAAGDVCTAGWTQTPHWTQIRLWTQARQMGMFAARCMVVSSVLQDIAFDIFTHVTTFFGFKVVLLGDFSGGKLEQPSEVHFRITEGHEYIKVLTKDSRVHGAVLIGDTDLEETIENLILDQVTIRDIERDLLNPNVDLEDYFD